jgi:glycosyltransferase involved in cell wall biosynthesis
VAGNPLVSVLVPTYKQTQYLSSTIASALSQTYTNIEVVISDDCSPDNTPEVAAEFRGDPRVRYERGGVNVGRVKNYRKSLYELSSGSYVTNLDGDDLLGDVDYLRKAVGWLERRDDADLCVGRVVRAHTPADVKTEEGSGSEYSVVDGTERFLRYWKDRRPIHHLGAVYRRTAAIDFYRRDIISADLESLLRLLPGRQLIECEAIAGIWRAHDDNASVNLSVEVALRNLAMADSVANDSRVQRALTNHQLRRWRFAMIRDRIYGSAVTHFLSKERKREAREFLQRAVTQYPGPGLAAIVDPRLLLYSVSPASVRSIKGRFRA